jgi:hypothetical protein
MLDVNMLRCESHSAIRATGRLRLCNKRRGSEGDHSKALALQLPEALCLKALEDGE